MKIFRCLPNTFQKILCFSVEYPLKFALKFLSLCETKLCLSLSRYWIHWWQDSICHLGWENVLIILSEVDYNHWCKKLLLYSLTYLSNLLSEKYSLDKFKRVFCTSYVIPIYSTLLFYPFDGKWHLILRWLWKGRSLCGED